MTVVKSRFYLKTYFFVLIISLLAFSACNQRSCIDASLNKMSKSKMMDIFVNKKFPSIDGAIYINERCEVVPKDSIIVLFGSVGDYMTEYYTNNDDEIKVVLIRKSNNEDREFIKSLRDSVNAIRKLEEESKRTVELVNIDCSTISSQLLHVYTLDQENRSGNNIDPAIDKTNLSIVVSILEKCDRSLFTEQDFLATWLVLQHSNSYQMKKYLNFLKSGVEQGLLAASRVALMEDRILISENKPQLYGSQVYMNGKGKWQVHEIKDVESVDERRAAVGLGPLSDYLSRWDIDYKKQ